VLGVSLSSLTALPWDVHNSRQLFLLSLVLNVVTKVWMPMIFLHIFGITIIVAAMLLPLPLPAMAFPLLFRKILAVQEMTLHHDQRRVGDSFMYDDNSDDPSLANKKVARLGQPKIGSDSGSVSSSFTTDDNGHVTSFDDISFEHDRSDLSDYCSSDELNSVGSKSLNGYEFYEETSFPAGVDDVVHVGLVDLCRRIKAPLYAYNEILHWAQDAKVQGYSFPPDAPHYSSFMSNLKR